MKDNEVDRMRYHSLYVYNELCRDDERREILRFVAMVLMAAAVAALIIFLSGCGAAPKQHTTPPGQAKKPVPPPVPPPPPPPPPPPVPVTLPATYAMSVLEPLPGYTDAQAEAISASGTIVGYSANQSIIGPSGTQATLWNTNGSTVDLGPGFALAINAGNEVVGYIETPDSDPHPQAYDWNTGQLQPFYGYDSSEATGVDDDGTIVGFEFTLSNPSHQQAVKWINGAVFAIDSLQSALGIHHGVVVGIDQNGMAATDKISLGIGGAATATSDAGITGFTFGAEPELLTWFNQTLRLPTTAAVGSAINSSGIIVGQLLGPAENVHRANTAKPRFVGNTTALGYTVTDGPVDLNSKTAPSGWTLVFASGISDKGQIVGAAVNIDTQQTAGFILEAQ